MGEEGVDKLVSEHVLSAWGGWVLRARAVVGNELGKRRLVG